jgi:steroid delta-isomerase-like uncharacterized protein
MSEEENKAVVRRFAEEVLSGHNLDVVAEIFAENFVDHDPGEQDSAGKEIGIEGAKAETEQFTTGFPDIRVSPEQIIAEGDKVVGRFTMTGTHTGTFLGIPPTGKSVNVTGIQVFRIADGKIAEAWLQIDRLGLLQQLGVVPSPGQ